MKTGIFIDEVSRDDNGKVKRVVAVIDNYLTIIFIWKNNKPEETCRSVPEDRLYSNEKLYIHGGVYAELLKQMWAIFQPSKSQNQRGTEQCCFKFT